MGTVSTKKKSKRIFYFDALRAFAIISVIIFHVANTCGDNLLTHNLIFNYNWLLTDVGKTCFRCGVDTFLMLSGALSLGRAWEIKPFLKKRIPRIAAPFLLWGFVLSLFVVGISYMYPSLIHVVDSFNVVCFLEFLGKAYLAKSGFFSPYWFFWMILGTYLIMPIFNRWLFHSDLKEAEYFLFFWLITCIFDYTIGVKFPVQLTYFSGPIGMVVLGYYLRHTKRKVFNNIWISILLIVISTAAAVYFSHMFSTPNDFYTYERYSIIIVAEVIGIFTLFKNLSNLNLNVLPENGIIRKAIFSIAQCSYGIYLTHRVVIVLFFEAYKKVIPYKPLFIILAILGLVIPWFVLVLLNKVPYLNEVIGVK